MLAKLARPIGDWLDRRSRLLPSMIARLGIDPEGGDMTDAALAMREAGQSCALCRNAGRCERWLGQGEDQGNDPYGYRAFCPNAGLLDHLPRRR
jgi:hypothetical protein